MSDQNSDGQAISTIPKDKTPAPFSIQDDKGDSTPVPTDAQLADALQIIGLVKLDTNTVRAFRQAGAYFRGHGAVHTVRGEAFVARTLLLQTMNNLADMVRPGSVDDKGKRRRPATVEATSEATKALAMGLGKLTDSQKLMLKLEEVGGNSDLDDDPDRSNLPQNKAFPTGPVFVAAGAQAHFHNTPAIKPESEVIDDIKKALVTSALPA